MQSWGIILNGQSKNQYLLLKEFRSYLTHIIKRIVSTCINYRIYIHVYDKHVYVAIIKKDIQNSKHYVRFQMPKDSSTRFPNNTFEKMYLLTWLYANILVILQFSHYLNNETYSYIYRDCSYNIHLINEQIVHICNFSIAFAMSIFFLR